MKRLLAIMALGVSLPALAWAQVGTAQNERYVVVLNPVSGPPAVVAEGIARATGGQVGFVYTHALRGFSISLPPRAAARLVQDQRIASIEPDIEMRAFEVEPTGVRRINAVANTAMKIDGKDERVDVDVAVLDTGIDVDHPDLVVAGGANCVSRFLFVTCDAKKSYDDDNFHGTHVAGTVAALDDLDDTIVGVAPGARLWAIKVLNSQGSGSLAGIIAGIDFVVGKGNIEVINMSLGGAGQSDAMDNAVKGAVDAGITVVVAAGNNAQNASGYTPANSPDAFTVSALADFDGLAGGTAAPTCRVDEDDTLANFSNFGDVVELAAPGVCILSTFPLERGGSDTISGTSMAAPHVAGAAAVLASQSVAVADRARVDQIVSTLMTEAESADINGSNGWAGNSRPKEDILDVSDPEVFVPKLVSADSGGGGTDGGGTTSPGKGNGKNK